MSRAAATDRGKPAQPHRRALKALAALGLGGWGLVYENPGVGARRDDGSAVTLRQITPARLPLANSPPAARARSPPPSRRRR